MPSGLRNQPKVLRGAFVEYGISTPRLVVVFQFNPLQLSRNRSQRFWVPASAQAQGEEGQWLTLRDFHQRKEFEDLGVLRETQQVTVYPESLSFEIRLDATDKLNEGDRITAQHGIAPQLATLELMVQPKGESILGQALDAFLPEGFSFTDTKKPPMILFIWGRKRVLPVNINSMQITETEFSPDLNPTRATVSVDLTIIEGPNPAYMYSKSLKDVMSALHVGNLALTTLADVKDIIIPG